MVKEHFPIDCRVQLG